MQDNHWSGVETAIDDPEEEKVVFVALDSYLQYAKVSHFNCTHLRRQAFYALPQAQWQMLAAAPFHFLETLDMVDAAIDSNADLARMIVKTGLQSFLLGQPLGQEPSLPRQWQGSAKHSDIDKARSTLRQFYRDWSAAGARERAACYGRVMEVLLDHKGKRGADAPPMKVLVPGAGLGRLVFDLALSGFDAEGNEISYHQLLASAYILNHCERAGKHTIYPWVHSFSNHRTRANHMRGYAIPDVHCASEMASRQGTGEMSMCAADFLCLYSDEEHADAYDAVASVFFLDTAPNLLRYLQTIFYCIKPGGFLVNFGPLLWHFENNAPGSGSDGEHDTSGIADPGSFELADDEVMKLVESIGFQVETYETGLSAPYIHDAESMLQNVFSASFWVARKPRAG
ncbi:N2227-domain-containing protein [Thozetella sp. PMI_491]|nr:N2227-domain-containing protein [Thozetella sp. PMI_491]